MATEGSDLSTRMSAEAQNIDKSIEKTARRLFKTHKVEISHKIKDSFPFFELLHDHDFITSELYDVSKETFKKGQYIEEVVYNVLSEVQKKFEPSLLKVLFNKFILQRNPDLNHIYEIFKTEIPDKNFFSENDAQENEETPDTQSKFEQAPPDKELSEKLSEIEEIIEMETHTTSNNNDALESQQANEQCAQQSDPAGAELHNHGTPVNSYPIVPVDIMKEKSFFSSGGELEAQARSDWNQESHVIEVSSEDSAERRNIEEPPKASPSALKRKSGTVDPESSSTSEKTKRKRRTEQQPDVPVNFQAEILPVNCKEKTGLLIKRKLERGAARKCIRTEDGNWFTPREFEIRGGNEKANNWKTSLTCGGKTLKHLMEHGLIHSPPNTRDKKKTVENSNKCEICQDGGKLFRCTCHKFFHEGCHLPPVNTERSGWKCTFCRVGNSPSQRLYRESEVLMKLMGPEEKLKCAFLLLNVYGPLESKVLPNIPHENYVEEASRCLENLRELDKIKECLIEGKYLDVKSFVLAMDGFFTIPSCNYAELTKDDFKKNFEDIFAIQEMN